VVATPQTHKSEIRKPSSNVSYRHIADISTKPQRPNPMSALGMAVVSYVNDKSSRGKKDVEDNLSRKQLQ
jgi:hypothetical protein